MSEITLEHIQRTVQHVLYSYAETFHGQKIACIGVDIVEYLFRHNVIQIKYKHYHDQGKLLLMTYKSEHHIRILLSTPIKSYDVTAKHLLPLYDYDQDSATAFLLDHDILLDECDIEVVK